MVNLPVKNLSLRQINIIIVAAAIAATFMILWTYIYLPLKASRDKTAEDLAKVKERIRQVEIYIPPGDTPQEKIRKLKEDFVELSAKLPADEGESMSMLTDFMRALNIDIDSTKTTPRKLLLDDANATVEIDEYVVQKMLVSYRLKTTYKALIELFAVIRESVPAYTSVERLVLEPPRGDSDKLEALLDLNFYLMSRKNE